MSNPSQAEVDNATVGVKRKPSRPASKVWEDFKQDKTLAKAICNHCKMRYGLNTSTTTLKAHLLVCPKNPNKVIDKKQKKLGVVFKSYENGLKTKDKPELGVVEFDQRECRIALAKMIIKDELSFRFVENEGFRDFMLVAQPQFLIPSRITVARDCMKLYFEEKSRLKTVFSAKSLRVCLTTDTWTSIQNLNYMCVTSHYIDEKWNYQKKILSFCLIPNHKGETIGRYLEKCLLEWGIERVTTITLDNASSNTIAIEYLSRKINYWKGDLLKGEFMHMRCAAHIINLIVNEGLKEKDDSIYRIRAAIKYVKSSPARQTKFDSCVKAEKIESKGSVHLDVCTRWNSTYLMLDTSQKFQKAFERLAEEDEHCFHALDNDKGKPTPDDWETARHLCRFLGIFYRATLCFSGSSYVTSNEFFNQFCKILQTLSSWSISPDTILSKMALNMQEKFDKYWDDDNKLNYYIFVAVVLDPRYKLGYVEYCFDQFYLIDKFDKKINNIKSILNHLYTSYSVFHPNLDKQICDNDQSISQSPCDDESDFGLSLSSQYEKRLKEKENKQKKSELERYLADSVEEEYDGFNILDWWRSKTSKYPVLSHIARDILAIPVSGVASESAFSTGGRILDPFCSSLQPTTVEALICAQNWFRRSKIDLRNQLDEIESIESDMAGLAVFPMDVEE